MKRGALARSVALAGSARAVTLPVSGVASLLSTNLLFRHYGSSGFAIYSLVAFLPMLLPAADLGVGGSVIDAVARRAELGRQGVYEVLRRGVRRLVLSAGLLISLSTGIAVLNLWPVVLGGGRHAASLNLAAGLSISVFAAGMPAALGLRILQGLERTHIAVLFEGGASAITLGLVWLAVRTNTPLAVVASAQSAAILLIGIGACLTAFPSLSRNVAGTTVDFRRPPLPRGLPLSGSFFVISFALPVTFQTDRLILAHTRGLATVAIYSAASQLWAPCVGLIGAAGQSLWPAFARHRAIGVGLDATIFKQAILLFSALGATFGIGLVVLGPAVTARVTNGEAAASIGVMAAFGLLLVATAIQYPGGMYLLDAAGARFQAWCAVLMALLNVPLAIVLSLAVGTSGPVLASASLSLAVMSGPVYWRIRQQHGLVAGGSRQNS